MLLKVFDGFNGWIMFDYVEQVHFKSVEEIIRSPLDFDKFKEDGLHILIDKRCFEENEFVIADLIEIHSKGTIKNALFTGVTYVLDSNGDTLDKFGKFPAKRRKIQNAQ